MKHLIIGAGAAGISAARTILKEKNDDSVVIVSQDAEVHSRCMLHKVIAGEKNAQDINFINDGLLESERVQWISGKTVTRLDVVPALKTVYAGEEAGAAGVAVASGDRVLIATGANSLVPPVGYFRTAKNAFGLRNLSDARAIAERAKTAKKIAVVGAGLVGLDAAYGILQASTEATSTEATSTGAGGREISVVEMGASVLAVNLDSRAAASYRRLFEEKGVRFYLRRKVVNTQGSPDEINALKLDDGTRLACDMVILAAGVSPATGFLEGSGIELSERRAVNVDDCLATNVPGVYAAGDVTGLSGVWPNAQKQGEVAGYNMTGTKLAYDDRFALKNTVNFFNLLSVSLGEINPQNGDEVMIREDRNNYRKLILRDGVPVGIILQGEIGGSGFWQYLIKNKVRIDNLGKSPWKVSYADFYGVENNGEYKWVV
ncbi:MAG: FAD-dependent oxidoreductase [Spirochaetes bacterium]|nr:FAD-dependent oxidoreductase [Spirochaetota bacterium]